MGLTLENIMSDKNDDLGIEYTKLRIVRENKQLTKADMADFLGMSHSSYHRKENRENEFTSSEIAKLMVVMNMTFYDLFTIDGELITV